MKGEPVSSELVGPELILGEDDLDETTKSMIQAVMEGVTILGDAQEAKRILFDSLPSAIAKRLKSITPPDFQISEIELKLSLSGKVFAAELSGDVVLKLTPKS